MPIWIRLKSIQYVEHGGVNVARHPGDWVRVGRSTALSWVEQGIAEIPQQTIYKHLSVDGAGVVLTNHEESGREHLRMYQGKLDIVFDDAQLPYKYTIIWNPDAPLRVELIPAGINFLDKWDLAMPLWSYEKLAIHAPLSQRELQIVQGVIRDLRIPLYDTRLMFVKRNETTERLLSTWKQYREQISDEMVAFLCALYEIKPLTLALPVTWTNPHYDG